MASSEQVFSLVVLAQIRRIQRSQQLTNYNLLKNLSVPRGYGIATSSIRFGSTLSCSSGTDRQLLLTRLTTSPTQIIAQNKCFQKKAGVFIRHFTGFSGTLYKKPTAFDEKKIDPNDELIMVKGDKVLKLKLPSTRLDLILKLGLQVSRNKVEKAFYEDRIRLNGERPKKKSHECGEGDEIDIVIGNNDMNPAFLDVSRIEIIKLGEEESKGEDDVSIDDSDDSEIQIPAVLKRYKRLTIENYDDKWKGPVQK